MREKLSRTVSGEGDILCGDRQSLARLSKLEISLERYTRVKKLFVDIKRIYSLAHSLVKEILSGHSVVTWSYSLGGSFSGEGDILWFILWRRDLSGVGIPGEITLL